MKSTPVRPAQPFERNAYLDTLRGGSIFGVICVHFAGSFVTTDSFVWSPSFYLGLTLNQIFSFAVPLFVFLSGVLAGFSSKEVSLVEYYRSRFWRIVFPYLLASFASFFLLNHYAKWQAIPGVDAKLIWLWQHLFFFGVEPTLYFIPLIIQLYLLQPVLKALPGWLNRLLPAISTHRFVLVITGLLLVLHLSLGILSYNGSLNYYIWCRPNALFWMFYFFSGLHYRRLAELISPRAYLPLGIIGLGLAAAIMIWNFTRLIDPAVVGLRFELNRLDFAYSRPEILLYDLAMVGGLAAGIVLGWAPRTGFAAYLGRYTLEIYLWHILVLYYGVWRYAEALASCRQMPDLIVIICATTALLIAGVTDWLSRLAHYIRHHRLVLIKTP